jgi:hypothetical protein
MRKRYTLVLAGSLGAVGLALVSCDDKKDDRPTSDKVEKAVEKTGEKVGQAVEKTGQAIERGAEKAAPAIGEAAEKGIDSVRHAGAKLRDAIDATPVETGEIMSTLGSTVDAVIAKDGLKVLPDNLTEADKTRIGEIPADAELENHLAKIRDLWTKKFNGIFNLRDPETVFKDAKISITTQNDRKIAVVTIPAKNDVPELKLNFVNEGKVINSWRLDIPDTMSKADLTAALSKQVKKVEDSAAKWPNDPYEAYRMVAQEILEPFSAPALALR